MSIIERDRIKLNDYITTYSVTGEEDIWNNQIMPLINYYHYQKDELLNMMIPIGPSDMDNSTNILFTLVVTTSKLSLENPEIIIEKIKILLKEGSKLNVFDSYHYGILYRAVVAISNKIQQLGRRDFYDQYDKYNTDILDFLIEQIVFNTKDRYVFMKSYNRDLRKIYEIDERLKELIPPDNKLSVGIGSYIVGKADKLFNIKEMEFETIQSKKRLSLVKQFNPRLNENMQSIMDDSYVAQAITEHLNGLNISNYRKLKEEETRIGLEENLQNEFASNYVSDISQFGGTKKDELKSKQNLKNKKTIRSLKKNKYRAKGGTKTDTKTDTNQLQRQYTLPFIQDEDFDGLPFIPDEHYNELQRQPTLQRQLTVPFEYNEEDEEEEYNINDDIEQSLLEIEEEEEEKKEKKVKFDEYIEDMFDEYKQNPDETIGDYYYYISGHGSLPEPGDQDEDPPIPGDKVLDLQYNINENWFIVNSGFKEPTKTVNIFIKTNSVCMDTVPVRQFTTGLDETYVDTKFKNYLKIVIEIKPEKQFIKEIYLYDRIKNIYVLFTDTTKGILKYIPNIKYLFNHEFNMGLIEVLKTDYNSYRDESTFHPSPEYLIEDDINDGLFNYKIKWEFPINLEDKVSSREFFLLDEEESLIDSLLDLVPKNTNHEIYNITLFNSTCLHNDDYYKVVMHFSSWAQLYMSDILNTATKEYLKLFSVELPNIKKKEANLIIKLKKLETELNEHFDFMDGPLSENQELNLEKNRLINEIKYDKDILKTIIAKRRDMQNKYNKIEREKQKIKTYKKLGSSTIYRSRTRNSNRQRIIGGNTSDSDELVIDEDILPEISSEDILDSLEQISSENSLTEQKEIEEKFSMYYQDSNTKIGNYYYYLSSHGYLLSKPSGEYNHKLNDVDVNVDISDFPRITKEINLFIKKRSGCLNYVLAGDLTEEGEFTFEDTSFQKYLKIVINIDKSSIDKIYLYDSKKKKYILFNDLDTDLNNNIPNVLLSIDNAFNSGLLESLKIGDNEFQPSPKNLTYNEDKELKVIWPYPLIDGSVEKELIKGETLFYLNHNNPSLSFIKKVLKLVPKNTKHKVYNIDIFLSSCLYSEESNSFIQEFNTWANIYYEDMLIATKDQLIESKTEYHNYHTNKYMKTHKDIEKNNKELEIIRSKIDSKLIDAFKNMKQIEHNSIIISKNLDTVENIIKNKYISEKDTIHTFMKEFQKYQLDIQKQYKLLGLESKFKDDPKFKTPEFISNLDKYRLFRRYFDDQKQLDKNTVKYMELNKFIEDNKKKIPELDELDTLYENIKSKKEEFQEQHTHLESELEDIKQIENRLKVLDTIKKLDMPTIFENTEGHTTRSKIKRFSKPTESKKKQNIKEE